MTDKNKRSESETNTENQTETFSGFIECTQRRKHYLEVNEYGLSGDGNGKDYKLWYGPGRDKMTFEQAWKRLMDFQGLPLDWEPPMYFERLSCVGCRGEHRRHKSDVESSVIRRPRRRRWSSLRRL